MSRPVKPPGSPFLDMVFAMMGAKTIHAAVELDIIDLLARESLTTEELAFRTRTHGPSLRRLLRALVALEMVAETGRDPLELTELGHLLRADVPGSMGSHCPANGSASRSTAGGRGATRRTVVHRAPQREGPP
jgi:hypothetical protein